MKDKERKKANLETFNFKTEQGSMRQFTVEHLVGALEPILQYLFEVLCVVLVVCGAVA